MPTIHLQGIGLHEARAYGDMSAGDIIVFNYGGRYEIRSIKPVTKNTLEIVGRDMKTNREYTFQRRASTLIGYGGKSSLEHA